MSETSDLESQMKNLTVFGCFIVGSIDTTFSVIPLDHIVHFHWNPKEQHASVILTKGPSLDFPNVTLELFFKYTKVLSDLMTIKHAKIRKTLLIKVPDSSDSDDDNEEVAKEETPKEKEQK
jgi:hypothetical protein